ncbi:2-oxoglutarate and iron-dependent oxygenase domain-containing protein [soil metagenome]
MSDTAKPFPPLIDLDGPDVPAQIDRACTEIGFFQIVGHGIPTEVIDRMLAQVDAFFGRPLNEKLAWGSGLAEIERGYSAKGTEGFGYSMDVEQPPDLMEALTMGLDELPDDAAYHTDDHQSFAPNIWPDDQPELRPAMLEYYGYAERTVHRITSLMAQALGMPADYFEPFTDRSMDALRVNWFEGSEAVLPNQFGVGAHTDYGVTTLLLADQTPGLQVYVGDEWIPVLPVEGALLVNIGDLMARWTNDRWRSTLHRVQPVQSLAGKYAKRRSIPFFHEGNFDAYVECLPTCCGPDNPAKYPPITSGAHVLAKILKGRGLTAEGAENTIGDRTAALVND